MARTSGFQFEGGGSEPPWGAIFFIAGRIGIPVGLISRPPSVRFRLLLPLLGNWCNGSTAGFEPARLGSNPGFPAIKKLLSVSAIGEVWSFPVPLEGTDRWFKSSMADTLNKSLDKT